MGKKKLVFISNMAAPYQVKLCYALQEYYNAEYWFYVHIESNRPAWWAIPLGDKCKVLKGSIFIPGFNYNNFNLIKELEKFDPEIIMLGGFFFPSHYFVKNWAKKRNKKVIVLSERISFSGMSKVKSWIKKIFKKIILSFFKDIDLIFALGEFAEKQYVQLFGFDQKMVVVTQYPQDIDENLRHPVRKTDQIKSLIFPNKLTLKYNPIFALQVFNNVLIMYPNLILYMNALGDLKEECIKYIHDNKMDSSIKFLDNIDSWDELPKVYQNADIALFTATDSNGPNTLIECMASGMGVILSKYIHNTGVYAHNMQNCFICELDIQCYFEAISKYIEKDNLISDHGQLSKKLVANRSINATANLYYDIIEKGIFLNKSK